MREEMMNRMAEVIKQELGMEYEVQFRNITKNNGLVLKAVIICESGMAVAPAIYIDEVLDQLLSENIQIREAAYNIINTYRKFQCKGDFGKIISCLSRQSILNSVTYQLINAEKNEDRLVGMPYKNFLDLSVVYRVIVDEDKMGISSFLISKELCEYYGIDKGEIDTAAKRNTERQGFRVASMDSIFAETTGESEKEIETDCLAWVLTNTKMINGATVMLYPEFFKDLADRIGRDLYVLPSSIHEVIAVPAKSDIEVEDLRSMVKAVNSELTEEEFLSDNVYKYCVLTKEMVICKQ